MVDVKQFENITSEEATQIRKVLRGKSKYTKKNIYREKENKMRFMDSDEWETFYYALKENIRKYFLFLFLTGMRYKEAKHVTNNHINWNNRTIVIYKPKGGIQRYANFSSYGKKYLKLMFEGKENNETLKFPTIQHLRFVLHKKCKEKNIKFWQDISVHNIRKQHENYLISLNFSQSKIIAHMGHTHKTAIEHYNSSEFIKDKKQLDKIRLWFEDIFG